jgi:hypothetical protein
VSVPHLSAAEARRLDWDIAGLWYTLADFDELVHGPRRKRFDTPQNRQLYAAQYARLEQLETKRYGAPVILSRTSRNQKGCAIIRAGAANWRGDDAGRAC